MKRSGFTLWEIIGVLGLMLIFAAVAYPLFTPRRVHGISPAGRCANNLKQISLGLMQYNQDYDERLPLIALSSASNAPDNTIPYEKKQYYGWADALYPYTKSTQMLHCPTNPYKQESVGFVTPTTCNYTDYWFNSNLSGKNLSDSKEPKQIITFGDGNDGSDLTDARYNLPALPAAWIHNKNSPAYRHFYCANYAFFDGHVKRLTSDQIVAGAVTFSPK